MLRIFTVQFDWLTGARVMAGVVFVFVREDASDVEQLAEAFDHAGYFISGSDSADDSLNVVVWSRAAMRSAAFRATADRALRSKRVVVASLVAPPHRDQVLGVPCVDISAWNGEDDSGLASLFEALLDVVHPARANVIALPAPVYIDAEFTGTPLQITTAEGDSVSRARAAWEAPIPASMLRPVHDDVRPEESPQPKLGAPSPRRDFRRLYRQSHNRANAALVFAVVALIGGAGFALNALATITTPLAAQHVAVTQQMASGGVSLMSASAEAIGLEDVVPVEPSRLFEPGRQIGHAGVEPPSARSVRRVPYAARRAAEGRILAPAVTHAPESQPAPISVAERVRSGPMS